MPPRFAPGGLLTVQYIKRQQKHHRNMTFQEEFLALLKKPRVACDERYLWD